MPNTLVGAGWDWRRMKECFESLEGPWAFLDVEKRIFDHQYLPICFVRRRQQYLF